MTRTILICSLILLSIVTGCGYDRSTPDTGTVSFNIEWRGLPPGPSVTLGISQAPIDCATASVYQISATVYNNVGVSVASGGPWLCSAHSGDIANVPVGTGMWVSITGYDVSNTIVAYGEQHNLTVTANATTNAGAIAVNYITTLAPLSNPTSIAVDSTNIYWTQSTGALKTVPISGGTTTVLDPGSTAAGAVAVDATSVYWYGCVASVGCGIKSILKSGGTPTLVTIAAVAMNLAADSTSIYYIDSYTSPGYIRKLLKSGGTPTALAPLQTYSGSSVYRLAIDSTSVYWTDISGSGGMIRKVGLNGGTPVTLASNLPTGIGGLAVDATNVYWATSSIQTTLTSGGTITNVTVSVWGYSSNTNDDIAEDGVYIYMADEAGITKHAKDRTSSVTLAPIATASSCNKKIALDAANIYWIDCAGVRKMPK